MKKVGLVKDSCEGCITTWKRSLADKVVEMPEEKLVWVKDAEARYLAVQLYLNELWEHDGNV